MPSGERRARLDPADPSAFECFLGDIVPEKAGGLSVVAGGLDAACASLAARGVRLAVAGSALRCPLQIAYDDPSQLGVDRWVAGCAARAKFGDALIVDCGTAVTFGVVSRAGIYQAGPIGPGLSTMGYALATRAPALPRFDCLPAASFPPRGSLDAVRAGVGLGFAAAVDAIACKLEASVGLERLPKVVTGGDAAHLLRVSSLRWIHVEGLVHDGLDWLLEDSCPSSMRDSNC